MAQVWGNMSPERQFRTLDVDVVAVNETWLRPVEGDNNLAAQDYSFLEWTEQMGK